MASGESEFDTPVGSARHSALTEKGNNVRGFLGLVFL